MAKHTINQTYWIYIVVVAKTRCVVEKISAYFGWRYPVKPLTSCFLFRRKGPYLTLASSFPAECNHQLFHSYSNLWVSTNAIDMIDIRFGHHNNLLDTKLGIPTVGNSHLDTEFRTWPELVENGFLPDYIGPRSLRGRIVSECMAGRETSHTKILVDETPIWMFDTSKLALEYCNCLNSLPPQTKIPEINLP